MVFLVLTKKRCHYRLRGIQLAPFQLSATLILQFLSYALFYLLYGLLLSCTLVMVDAPHDPFASLD